MNPLTFQDFKSSIRGQLKLRKISFADVDYIALSKTYWTSFDEFMSFEDVPSIWIENNEEEDLWDHIDTEFRVVLKDGKWLQYIYIWSDPYYSHFRMMSAPSKPPANLEKNNSKQEHLQN